MPDKLERLLEMAKKYKMSPEEEETQRQSFAYGNTNIENPRITREMIKNEAKLIKSDDK